MKQVFNVVEIDHNDYTNDEGRLEALTSLIKENFNEINAVSNTIMEVSFLHKYIGCNKGQIICIMKIGKV